MLRQRLQLGMLHAAVAITLVPINSTLNRVMIKELAVSATLVAVLASLPYLFSPIQVLIGSFADRHPIWGLRRTPYILLGLLLCVGGLALSPLAAFTLAESPLAGVLVGMLAFGAWGMGYNFAAVSYLALASELSGEQGRGRTVAVMFFVMIVSIILTAITLSYLVDPYTPERMERAFWIVGGLALLIGLLGLIKLEPRLGVTSRTAESYSLKTVLSELGGNRAAAVFFIYLTILLAAILGQDVLLEPYGGEAFAMSVRDTTRITSLWGVCMLLALVAAGVVEGRVSKRRIAIWGGATALGGFLAIALSGFWLGLALFYAGVILLGVGTGLSTVSNLSLMLDMITPGKVGLYMGAWGMANAFSRLVGSVLGGAVRDIGSIIASNPVIGYTVVFFIEAALLLISLFMLGRIDVSAFRHQAESLSVVERAAIVQDP